MHSTTTMNRFRNITGSKWESTKGDFIEIRDTDRESLAQWLGLLGFTQGVEVGVEAGRYAEVLFRNNPGLTLYGVDPWLAYAGYREHVSQDKLDEILRSAQDRLRPYDWHPMRSTSVDAAAQFKDGSLDFVYIDGNHTFVHVAQDLHAWIPKVRSGGIVAGHDFIRQRGRDYTNHVVNVVTAWTRAYDIKPWFVIGAQDKVEGERRDRARSYMWIKE